MIPAQRFGSSKWTRASSYTFLTQPSIQGDIVWPTRGEDGWYSIDCTTYQRRTIRLVGGNVQYCTDFEAEILSHFTLILERVEQLGIKWPPSYQMVLRKGSCCHGMLEYQRGLCVVLSCRLRLPTLVVQVILSPLSSQRGSRWRRWWFSVVQFVFIILTYFTHPSPLLKLYFPILLFLLLLLLLFPRFSVSHPFDDDYYHSLTTTPTTEL